MLNQEYKKNLNITKLTHKIDVQKSFIATTLKYESLALNVQEKKKFF